jgi:hypothetical protein
LSFFLIIVFVAGKQAKTRAKTTNKLALEAEKEKDAVEKTVEELKRQIQPKRSPTHDTSDDHEMIAEVDNGDLSVHRQEATRVQNRRNVALGSLHDQPKPLTGKDGSLIDLLVPGCTRTK